MTRTFNLSVYNAVHWYYDLVSVLDPQRFAIGLGVMKEAVQQDNQYSLGWAILGETYVAGHFNRFDCQVPDPLTEAIKCGKIALKIDPHCHHAYQTLALAYLFSHQREECIRIVRSWIGLNSYSAGVAGGLGFCLICCSELDEGYSLLSDSIDLNPYYPWWLNAGLSFYHFLKGEYQEAIYWADLIHGRSVAWEMILKAACYGALDRFGEAAVCAKELRASLPAQLDASRLVHDFTLPEEFTRRLLALLAKIDS